MFLHNSRWSSCQGTADEVKGLPSLPWHLHNFQIIYPFLNQRSKYGWFTVRIYNSVLIMMNWYLLDTKHSFTMLYWSLLYQHRIENIYHVSLVAQVPTPTSRGLLRAWLASARNWRVLTNDSGKGGSHKPYKKRPNAKDPRVWAAHTSVSFCLLLPGSFASSASKCWWSLVFASIGGVVFMVQWQKLPIYVYK